MSEEDEGVRKGDVQAALEELGRRAELKFLAEDPVEGSGAPVALLPKGFEVRSLKPILDEYLPRPERRRGTVVLTELGSLAEYVNLYKADETLVYIDDRDLTAPRISVVFDEHESTTRAQLQSAEALQADDDGPSTVKARPGWREHRAGYAFPLTPEWRDWVEVSKKELPQAAFAAFLEDHVTDVVSPSDPGEPAKKMAEELGITLAGPAKLLELSRGLAINVDQKVMQAQNLSTGEGSLTFEEVHKDTGGAPLKVPGAFAIAVPVFRGGDLYRIPVRLKYRVSGGRVLWSLQPYRMDQVFENAIEGAAQYLREKTAVTVLRGAP